MNTFLTNVRKGDTHTENGAISNSTTGSNCLDYFSKAGSMRGRSQSDINSDMAKIFAEDEKLALEIVFYNRLITRNTVIKGKRLNTVQKGQGNKDEFYGAINWLHINKPELLYPNLHLIPLVGTWKDMWHEKVIDVIDRTKVFELITLMLMDDKSLNLIKKYLPQHRSASDTKNDRHRKLNKWVSDFCYYANMLTTNGTPDYKLYRQFKTSGDAHTFQKQISKEQYEKINWSHVPGKALFNLTVKTDKNGTTFIDRHDLEKSYLEWLDKQKVAKFTGYVYELYKQVKSRNMKKYQSLTVNKQYDGLIDMAKKDQGGLRGNVWCAIDTSASMTYIVDTDSTQAIDVCVSLGIYFSELNEGAFKNNIIFFDNESKVYELKGKTFSEKVAEINNHSTAWGSTNFQSVIDSIVRVRQKNPDIPISDYPETLLVVSDIQFNPTGNMNTNYEEAMRKLRSVGLPEINIIWWDVTGRSKDVPATKEDKGTVVISGFDGSIITSILGGQEQTPKKVSEMTPYEMMKKSLNQEIIKMLI